MEAVLKSPPFADPIFYSFDKCLLSFYSGTVLSIEEGPQDLGQQRVTAHLQSSLTKGCLDFCSESSYNSMDIYWVSTKHLLQGYH